MFRVLDGRLGKQELFDAIVVNPYDEDAVADAIADTWPLYGALWQRFMILKLCAKSVILLLCSQIGLELTRGNRLSEEQTGRV